MRLLEKLLSRRHLDRDLEDELRFHLEMSSDPRRFGNATLIKETCREMWSFVWLESLWQDFSYALRVLAQTPVVTAAAMTALALGIGANTTVYTIISKALNFDIGVDRPERLVLIAPDWPYLAESSKTLFDPLILRSRVTSLDGVAAFRFREVNLSDTAGLAERYTCFEISAEGFQILGRSALFGRAFTEEKSAPTHR